MPTTRKGGTPSPRRIRDHALSHDLVRTLAARIIQRDTIDINPKVRVMRRQDFADPEKDPDTDSVIPAKAGIQTSSGRNRPQISQITPICSFAILIRNLIASTFLLIPPLFPADRTRSRGFLHL